MRQIHVRCGGCTANRTFPANERNLNMTVKELVNALPHKMDCYTPSIKVKF